MKPMMTKNYSKKLSTAVQLIEQTCSTNLTAPVQKIEQHNNKQNINNKQRAIYKKDFRRIASSENKTMIKIKKRILRLLISCLTLVLEIVKLLYIWAIRKPAGKMAKSIKSVFISPLQWLLSHLAIALLSMTNLLLTKLITTKPKEVQL